MYFCANPKCKFHKDVSYNRRTLTVVISKPEPMIADMSKIPSEYSTTVTETREKHKWENPSRVFSEFFLCDVCHEAALMVKENA